MGDGWYKMSGTVTCSASAQDYGVQVKAEKLYISMSGHSSQRSAALRQSGLISPSITSIQPTNITALQSQMQELIKLLNALILKLTEQLRNGSTM
jgi:hypothetical protein